LLTHRCDLNGHIISLKNFLLIIKSSQLRNACRQCDRISPGYVG
jgi:hypothetical protein